LELQYGLARFDGSSEEEAMARGEQGTGKHPHKSTEEPYPHTKDEKQAGSQGSERGGRGGDRGGEQSREAPKGQGTGGERGGGGDDLKSREYRDEKGEIHHHTRTYQEQHKGE
jgi:hypothetical protein